MVQMHSLDLRAGSPVQTFNFAATLITKSKIKFKRNEVYHWLRMQSEWETKIPSLKLHILCPDGNWSDAAVVAFADGLAADGKQYGVVYAREGRGDERLADALLRTRAIPWHTMIHFTCVLQRHVKPVKVAARAAGVSLPPDNVCYLVNFPQSALKTQYDALSFEMAAGFRIAKLSKENVDEVWRLRTYFPECYKPVVGAILEHNASAGIFVKLEDGSEKLVSMVMHGEHGGLAMGKTHPNFQRQGFNSIVGSFVIGPILRAGYQPFSYTAIENNMTIPFLEKAGFSFIGIVEHIYISPESGKGHL